MYMIMSAHFFRLGTHNLEYVLPWTFSGGRGVLSCMVTGCRGGGSSPALPLSSLRLLITGLQDAADACGGRTP